MFEAFGVLPFIEFFLNASLFDTPVELLREEELAYFWLLLQEALLLDTEHTLSLQPRLDELLDEAVDRHRLSDHAEVDKSLHEGFDGRFVLCSDLRVLHE